MQLELYYFDFHGGRGEPARLMLTTAGMPFVDHRIPGPEWPRHRDRMPLKAVPMLEVEGYPLTQSTTINRFVARLTGMYPEDRWQSILCDEVCDMMEDLNQKIGRTFGVEDPEELKRQREALVAGPLTVFLGRLDDLLGERGEYFADGRLTVADITVFVNVRSLNSGRLDHVPEDLVASVAPRVQAHAERTAAEPGIQAYYADAGS